jgi:hypothetical protein
MSPFYDRRQQVVMVVRRHRRWPWVLFFIWVAFLCGSYLQSNRIHGPPKQPAIGALPPVHPLPLAPMVPR